MDEDVQLYDQKKAPASGTECKLGHYKLFCPLHTRLGTIMIHVGENKTKSDSASTELPFLAWLATKASSRSPHSGKRPPALGANGTCRT